MLTCKQVSKALAENRFDDLPSHKRMGLQLHLKFCMFCGKANTQVIQLQKGIKKMHDKNDDELYVNVRLSDEAKNNIKEKMSTNSER
jgi:hypothetical protein